MNDFMTISSGLVAIQTKEQLSPAMRSVIWQIAAALDAQRVPIENKKPVWLNIGTSDLRGLGGKNDNTHLKGTLDRLCGVYLTGDHRGDQWGAMILAEWHLTEGGAVAELLIPPSAVAAIRSPQTFARIETRAAHSLSGHARQLYLILADKKNLRQRHWIFGVDELRALMGVAEMKTYDSFGQFRKKILNQSLDQINDFGTVSVEITLIRRGRSIREIRFDWRWKDPHDATETAIKNERHSAARRKGQDTTDTPPMIEDHDQPEPALTWWHSLTDAERDDGADQDRTHDPTGRPRRQSLHDDAPGSRYCPRRLQGDFNPCLRTSQTNFCLSNSSGFKTSFQSMMSGSIGSKVNFGRSRRTWQDWFKVI